MSWRVRDKYDREGDRCREGARREQKKSVIIDNTPGMKGRTQQGETKTERAQKGTKLNKN